MQAVAYTDLIKSLIMIIGVVFILSGAVSQKVANVANIGHMSAPPEGNFLEGMTPLYTSSEKLFSRG